MGEDESEFWKVLIIMCFTILFLGGICGTEPPLSTAMGLFIILPMIIFESVYLGYLVNNLLEKQDTTKEGS